MRTVDNTQDFLDSRDIITRIEELERDETELDEQDKGELAVLRALATEGEGCADWQYGVTLIRDSYFEEYAQEFAEDIGAISRDAQWPLYCIDWEHAASELQVDYTALDFDGVTYWAR